MAVIPYTALVGALAANASVPAPLARLSQGLLRAASRLHVATGWGASEVVAGGRNLSVRAYGPSWEWVTVAAQVVPLDGATTWKMRVRGTVTGDVYVRADRRSDGVAWVDDVMVLDAAPRPIGGGLAVVELQIRSVYAYETTASVTWVDALTMTVTLGTWEPRELFSGPDRYVVTGENGANDAVWPARRPTSGDGSYTVGTLGYLDVLGVHVWGESDGESVPTQRGDVRTLRVQDFAHRSAAARLLGRTPYVQDLHVIDASNSPPLVWWQVESAVGQEVDLWDDLPVDEQEAYALTLVGVHNGLGASTVRLRLYVDGVDVGSTDATWPALQPDTGDGGSTLRFWATGGQAAPFWREEPLALETVTVQASGATPGTARITLEIIDGDATLVVVAALALVPTRPVPAVTPIATGTNIDSLAAYLTAPDAPWGTLRREIATWQDLAFTTSAAVSVYEASPVPTVRVRVDAVLTECTLEVEITEDDGVTVVGTILLDATGETDEFMSGSIDVPGGEWYYVRVDTTDAGSGAVGGVRLYEEKLVDPTSLEYADRATLLADTGRLVGATGYVPSYAAPVEVWQWDGADWLLLGATGWDGETSGQTWTDLQGYPGVEGAQAQVGDTSYQYMVLTVHANVTAVTELGVWVPAFVASRSPVLYGYATGAEANTAALTAQGLQEQLTGLGAFTYSGTEIVGSYGGGATASVTRLRVPEADTPTAIWITALARATNPTNSLFVLGHGDGANITWIAAPGGSGADTLNPSAANNGTNAGTGSRTYPAVADTLPEAASTARRIEMYRVDAANAEYLVASRIGGRGVGFSTTSKAATVGLSKGGSSGAGEVRLSSVYMVGYTL